MTDYTVKCAFSTIIVIYLYPWLIVFAVIQMIYLIKLRRKALCATRDTIRLKFSLVSPVNSLIQDAVNGLPTLKCLGKINFYMQTLFESIDLQTSAFITSSAGNRWVAFRIDLQAFLIASVFAFVAIFLTKLDSQAKIAMIAVGFQQAMDVTRLYNMAIRWSVNVESNMLSIQRLIEYTKLPAERGGLNNIEGENVRSPTLELEGKIQFDNVQMSYSADLQPALKDLSFTILPGEHVAVVGRTGAGKSSLFQLLLGFRQCQEGQVLLDDKDITSYDLNHLRSEINVVLQQPFVTPSETIRKNLDPQNLYSDRILEAALIVSSLIQPGNESGSVSLD